MVQPFTEFSGKMTAKYTQIFWEIFYREFLFHFISSRNCLSRNFQSNGLLVGNCTIPGFSENFPWKFPYDLYPFRMFFGMNLVE